MNIVKQIAIIEHQRKIEELTKIINLNKKKYKIIEQQKEITELNITIYTNKNRYNELIVKQQEELDKYNTLLKDSNKSFVIKQNKQENNIKLKEFEIEVNKLLLLPRNIRIPGTRKEQIPKALKDKVWTTYISEENRKGKCFCCQNHEIANTNFNCGHVISENDGGRVILENFRPICQSCNSSMGTKNMYEFIRDYGLWKN
jgi:hypothetical protein